MEDYQQGRAPRDTGRGSVGPSAGFNQSSTGGFGGFGGGFGQQQTSQSGFGMFGNQQPSSGFGQSQPPSGLFGSGFAQTSAPQSSFFGGFGQSSSSQPAAFGGLGGWGQSSSPGLFGQQQSSSSGFLFGQQPSPQQAGGLFGNQATSSSSLFGQPSSSSGFGGFTAGLGGQQASSSTSFGGGLFGQTSSSSFGGSLFGQKPSSSSLFGGFTQSTNGGLFGQSSKCMFGGFGQSSSSTSSLFGTQTSSGLGLFGNQQSSTSSLFGMPSSSSSLFSSFGQGGQGGLFGSGQSSSTNQFGQGIQPQSNGAVDPHGIARLVGFLSQSSNHWVPNMNADAIPKEYKDLRRHANSQLDRASERLNCSPPRRMIDGRRTTNELGWSTDEIHAKVCSARARDPYTNTTGSRARSSLSFHRPSEPLDDTQSPRSTPTAHSAKLRKDFLMKYVTANKGASPPAASVAAGPVIVCADTHEAASSRPPRGDLTSMEVEPSWQVLREMSDRQLAAVKDFTIRRPAVGEIRWTEPVDLRAMDLDCAIEWGTDFVHIYGEKWQRSGRSMPAPGQGLRAAGLVTFFDVRPATKAELTDDLEAAFRREWLLRFKRDHSIPQERSVRLTTEWRLEFELEWSFSCEIS